MDAEALAAEAKVLSAYYSFDTVLNLHPRRHLNTSATATESGNETVPTLSPAVLAFLAAHHLASQLQFCSFGRTDLTLDPDTNAFFTDSDWNRAAQDVATLVNRPVVNVPKVPDDLPLKRYFVSYVIPIIFALPPRNMPTWPP